MLSDRCLAYARDELVIATSTLPKVTLPDLVWLPSIMDATDTMTYRHPFGKEDTVLLWTIEEVAFCTDRFHYSLTFSTCSMMYSGLFGRQKLGMTNRMR